MTLGVSSSGIRIRMSPVQHHRRWHGNARFANVLRVECSRVSAASLLPLSWRSVEQLMELGFAAVEEGEQVQVHARSDAASLVLDTGLREKSPVCERRLLHAQERERTIIDTDFGRATGPVRAGLPFLRSPARESVTSSWLTTQAPVSPETQPSTRPPSSPHPRDQ